MTDKFDRFPPKLEQLEPFSERFDAHRLKADGCDVYFASYPAGTEIEPHTHDTDNWGVITKGRMFITMDGRETGFGPGEWYHVPAGAVHAARCDSDTQEIELWFQEK